MNDEILVFCARDNFRDRDAYVWFWHEADVLLYALGREVAEKKITAAEARQVYGRYFDVEDTYVIEPEHVEAEKEAILRDWEKYYTPEELEDELEDLIGEYSNFPRNEELDYLPNSSAFWEEAAELDIPGVGYSDDESPASGPIFEVHGADALLALQEAVRGRYRVVVEDGFHEYTGADSQGALQFIQEAHEQ